MLQWSPTAVGSLAAMCYLEKLVIVSLFDTNVLLLALSSNLLYFAITVAFELKAGMSLAEIK